MIQEGTLISAAVDSWPHDQINRSDGSRLASRLGGMGMSPRSQVYCPHSRSTLSTPPSLNAFLVSKRTGCCSDPQPDGQWVQLLSQRNRVFLAGRHCPRLGPLEFCDSLINTQAGQDCTPICPGSNSCTVQLRVRETVFVHLRVAAEVASSQSLRKGG